MIHELPTEAQLGDGATHFRVERVIEHVGGSIHAVGKYGSLDGDGNFIDAGLGNQSVAISDRETYDAETTDHPSASKRADPVSHMHDDVLAFLDAKGLWPGQS